MREVREFLRQERRAYIMRRVWLGLFWAFPVAFVGFLAGCAWGLLSDGFAALWLAALPISFIAAVVGGLQITRLHEGDVGRHSAWRQFW